MCDVPHLHSKFTFSLLTGLRFRLNLLPQGQVSDSVYSLRLKWECNVLLGAAAEFERALIRERTKAGLASARTKGRIGGTPGLRSKDPAALRKVRLARQDGYIERLNENAQDWVPHVRRLRPDMAWEDVLRIINGPLPDARRWTQSRLLCAVNA